MSYDEPTIQHEPTDRLTRICAAMTDVLVAHPEFSPGVQCAIFLHDDKVGGLVLSGYEDQRDAVADVLGHLRAILKTQGVSLELIVVPDDASEL